MRLTIRLSKSVPVDYLSSTCDQDASVELTSLIKVCHQGINGFSFACKNSMNVKGAGKYQAKQTAGRRKIKREGSSTLSPAPRSNESASARRLDASGNQQWLP